MAVPFGRFAVNETLFVSSIDVEASISDLWLVPFGRDVSDQGTS